MGLSYSISLPLGALGAFVLYVAYTEAYLPTRGPRIAPGPESAHWFFGNQRQGEQGTLHARLIAEYGPVVSYISFGHRPRLLTADTRALAHILTHTDVYQKPAHTQRAIARLLGAGVLVAEGEQHRLQRKALNLAFGPGQIRDLTGIMLDKANELRDVLAARLGPDASVEVDIPRFFSHCTLDIIGLAGFGYDFAALSTTGNALAGAFDTLFGAAQQPGIVDLLALLLPGLRYLPTKRNRQTVGAMAVMRRIGSQLLAERKAKAEADAAQGEKLSDARPRDILSLLVRANTAADPRQRLSDEDVLAQIPTFLVAGHETTATLLSWIILALTQRPDIQRALRAECRASPLPRAPHGNSPLSAEALAAVDKLPLLDAVVRETLRLHAPVPSTVRAATCADMLPLSAPFMDREGKERTSVPMRKGEVVVIPVRLVNRAEAIWGADAGEWRPERWLDGSVGERAKAVPGVWGHTLSFLGGPHACIGYRFSLYETKLILHVLLATFEVELAVPAAEIGEKRGIVTRPAVKGAREDGAQMPVVLRRVEAE